MSKDLIVKLNIVLLVLLTLALLLNQFQYFLIAVGIIGTLFVAIDAVKAIIKKEISVDLLAAIALFASVLNFEWMSVVFINLMITSARIFGQYTEGVASGAIKSLLKIRPEKVKIKENDKITEVPLAQVKAGDMVIVETGDRVAVDGVIVEGEASIDQSTLTGESIPVSKEKGDRVLSATLNLSGTILVRVEKIGKDTTFEKILRLIEEAQNNKVKIVTLGQKFASWYVALSLVGSIIIYVFSHNLSLVLSVLLVVCADDIAIAVPMAFWAAIGYAAKRGIIVKGTDILEGVTKVKTLIVDKTGTLTRGKIKITGVGGFRKEDTKHILALVSGAESISDHPIARAIVAYAKEKGVTINAPSKFKEFPAKGVIVNKGKGKLIVGKVDFIKEQGVNIDKSEKLEIDSFLQGGSNLVLVALNSKLIGFVTFEDDIKPKIRETINRLRAKGIENVYMLTGDNQYVAKKIAHDAGITDFQANLLPDQKLQFVKEHLSQKAKIAFVGDGVNDAAALAQADIGIAMGAIGADAAIESADIALMNDDFSKIDEAITIGNFTLGVAKQNFAIWMVVNVVGLFLVFNGTIGPSGAALYNFLTDFLPIANSLRLLGYRFFKGFNLT